MNSELHHVECGAIPPLCVFLFRQNKAAEKRRSPNHVALLCRPSGSVRTAPYNDQNPARGAFMQDRIAYQGITFDDVHLEPAYSDVLPRDVEVRTHFTRNIGINIPIISSPMDTVTESELAIALAQEGGIG